MSLNNDQIDINGTLTSPSQQIADINDVTVGTGLEVDQSFTSISGDYDVDVDVDDTSISITYTQTSSPTPFLSGLSPGIWTFSDLDLSTGNITGVTQTAGNTAENINSTSNSVTVDLPITSFPGLGTPVTYTFEIECFLSGTHILTDKGEITVENLQIGDRVVTAEGKLEPVKWIGYQTVQPNQVKNPLRGYPILIKAGALGNNLPQRDLYVSPDHAMFFEGVLINAGALVNGTSIVKTEPQSAFTYYHVELENHALLLAEGAKAESYLPQNEERLAYENGAEYEELYPHGSKLMLWPMDYPRISSWHKVPRYMRKKLNAIAEELKLVFKAV